MSQSNSEREKIPAGYILAGGGSIRFGRDKALAEIDGQTMLQRMNALLRTVADPVLVIAAPGKYSSQGVECLPDLWPGEGPLGGIVTALCQSELDGAGSTWNLIVSCDLPFLSEVWLRFLMERAAQSKADVVLPRSEHALEPLCACYRTSARPVLEEAFAGGVRKVTEALRRLRCEVLDEKEWKRFDETGQLFWNMNTVADYEEALKRSNEAEK